MQDCSFVCIYIIWFYIQCLDFSSSFGWVLFFGLNGGMYPDPSWGGRSLWLELWLHSSPTNSAGLRFTRDHQGRNQQRWHFFDMGTVWDSLCNECFCMFLFNIYILEAGNQAYSCKRIGTSNPKRIGITGISNRKQRCCESGKADDWIISQEY